MIEEVVSVKAVKDPTIVGLKQTEDIAVRNLKLRIDRLEETIDFYRLFFFVWLLILTILVLLSLGLHQKSASSTKHTQSQTMCDQTEVTTLYINTGGVTDERDNVNEVDTK